MKYAQKLEFEFRGVGVLDTVEMAPRDEVEPGRRRIESMAPLQSTHTAPMGV